jgi:nicotinate-nucleotide adenylyltransferase
VRVGILGGTFNPPHLGHLVCAQEAYLHLDLDRIMLMPARVPPHKPVEDEPGPDHRLELCRRAVRDDERFEVSELEISRDGPSYTVDTLRELTSKAPDNELFLILGGDIAAGLPQWHEPQAVLSLATLAIAERSGTTRGSIDGALDQLGARERARFFPMPTIDVSSTEIRRRAGAGEPFRYMVPDAVHGYIIDHGLYRGNTLQ